MPYPNQYMPGYYQQPYYNPGNAVPDMLNQYKNQYQPQQIQMPVQQQPPVQPPTPQNDIIWVQGEAGAKAYLVAPGNTVTLWDSENPTIYVKSADASGIPSMRVLDWTERNATPIPKQQTDHACQCGDKFILKEDFSSLENKYQEILCRLSDVESKYEKLSVKPTPKTAKKVEDE